MSSTKPKGNVTVTYSGGLDGVTLHFPSGHVHTFLRGDPVEVCAEDAKSVADNPDFAPAPKAATKTSEED